MLAICLAHIPQVVLTLGAQHVATPSYACSGTHTAYYSQVELMAVVTMRQQSMKLQPFCQKFLMMAPPDKRDTCFVRDIVINAKQGGVVTIDAKHHLTDPLHFVLLMCNGEWGWRPNIMQSQR